MLCEFQWIYTLTSTWHRKASIFRIMKWELDLWVWQQDDWHHWLSVTCFCVAVETTLLLLSGANSVEKKELVERNGIKKKKKKTTKKNMAACMSHLLTHTLGALQFSHCEQPVRALCMIVAKHSRRRDHTREQKQHQTVVKTTREDSDHLWLKHIAVFNSEFYRPSKLKPVKM